jgi:hypothetical protein
MYLSYMLILRIIQFVSYYFHSICKFQSFMLYNWLFLTLTMILYIFIYIIFYIEYVLVIYHMLYHIYTPDYATFDISHYLYKILYHMFM